MAKNPRLKDMTGQVLGTWTVIRQDGNHKGGGALWLCRCSCGVERRVGGGDLRSGKSRNCGCVSLQLLGQSRKTHGVSKSRLYYAWKNMKSRCGNPSNTHFANYGGRGIRVCEEWQAFEPFQAWALANGYRDDLTLERVDVDGGYNPGNCTWANAVTQANNRRFVRRTKDGTPGPIAARSNGIKTRVYAWRINNGWPVDEAATVPEGTRRFGMNERGPKGTFIGELYI